MRGASQLNDSEVGHIGCAMIVKWYERSCADEGFLGALTKKGTAEADSVKRSLRIKSRESAYVYKRISSKIMRLAMIAREHLPVLRWRNARRVESLIDMAKFSHRLSCGGQFLRASYQPPFSESTLAQRQSMDERSMVDVYLKFRNSGDS